jgi:hypothetical protein
MVIASSGWTEACRHHPHAAAIAAVASADSLTGIVSVTGTSFEQQLVLRIGTRAVTLLATSMDSASLVRVAGTEVVAYGRAADSRFRVDSFTVRSVDGAAVADGTLQRAGGRLGLQTSTALLTLGNPPSALDSLVGARVWIAGSLATGPNVYGIISPAP